MKNLKKGMAGLLVFLLIFGAVLGPYGSAFADPIPTAPVTSGDNQDTGEELQGAAAPVYADEAAGDNQVTSGGIQVLIDQASSDGFTDEQIVNNDYILYFVNAGDPTPATTEGTDRMGLYTGSTEQIYGADPKTGKNWGLVTTTTGTNVPDTSDKNGSLRYYNGPQVREKSIKYAFELPEGTYDITFGFKNPWSGRSVGIKIGNTNVSNGDYDIGANNQQKEVTYRYQYAAGGILNVEICGPSTGTINQYNDPLVNWIIVRKLFNLKLSDLTDKITAAKAEAAKTDYYTRYSINVLNLAIQQGETTVSTITSSGADVNSEPVQGQLRGAIAALNQAMAGLSVYVPGSSFNPGAQWVDTDGEPIQAHGGGVLYDSNTGKYYWYGEDKTNGYTPTSGIRVYSSTDLYNWKNEGLALTAIESMGQFDTDPLISKLYEGRTDKADIFNDIGTTRVLERPKVIYNDKTKKYVMWLHTDGPSETSNANYAKAEAGYALSDSPTGPFVYGVSNRMDRVPEGASYDGQPDQPGMARDMNLFKDDDGTAYLIYSGEENMTIYISKLNDSYTDVTGWHKDGSGTRDTTYKAVYGVDYIRVFPGSQREAPAMFKYNGKYYLITSGATGWAPNRASYTIASQVFGEWRPTQDPSEGAKASTTFDSQSTCVIPVDAATGKFIYMGDRWNQNNLADSRYIWLPVEFNQKGDIKLKWYEQWNLGLLDNMAAPTADTLTSPNKNYKLVNVNSGLSLTIAGTDKTTSAKIQQSTDTGNSYQRWQLIRKADGYYNIISRYSGMAMAIAGGSTADGADNIQWAFINGLEQDWKLNDQGNGIFTIENRKSGKVLDFAGSSTLDGAQSIQATATGGSTSQQFRIEAVSDIVDENAVYKIVNRNSGKNMGISENKIVQVDNSLTENQRWKLTSLGNGYFSIENYATGNVLDVENSSTVDGGSIIQSAPRQSVSQQWLPQETAPGYMTFFNRNSGKVAGVGGSSTASGATIIQWSTDYKTKDQQWQLVNDPMTNAYILNGGFEENGLSGWTIRGSAVAASAGMRTGNGAVQLNGTGDTVEQTITGLQPNTSYTLKGYAKVSGAGSEVRIGARSFGGNEIYQTISSADYSSGQVDFITGPYTNSVTVYLYQSSGSGKVYGDDFTLAPSSFEPGESYKIISRDSGKVMDSTSAGIVQMKDNGAMSQRWVFTQLQPGKYTVTNKNSSKMLQVSGASQAGGAPLSVADADNSLNQQWSVRHFGGGVYRFSNLNSNQTMEVANDFQTDGAVIDQGVDDSSLKQQWFIQPVKLSISPLFSDHMVLQRNEEVPIYGTAKDGELITVSFNGQTLTTTAVNGQWKVNLQPMSAGGPYDLIIHNSTHTVKVSDVMMGEVWLLAGQSNMEYGLSDELDGAAAVADSVNQDIRLFRAFWNTEVKDARWERMTPDTAGHASAVGYYFAKQISNAMGKVPVGLIQASWGGTRVAQWTSAGGAPTDAQLYNRRYVPLQPYKFKGMLWYQGESDSDDVRAPKYTNMLTGLINEWRQAWGGTEFPVGIVQLAIQPPGKNTNEWALVMDSQLRVAQTVRNAGIACAWDLPLTYINALGMIHPNVKKPIGIRFANWAESQVYKLNTGNGEYTGPMPDSARSYVSGNKMFVAFSHAGSGLMTTDGKAPASFLIAGADGVFYSADAAIDSTKPDTLVLTSPSVQYPMKVRYLWDVYTKGNLTNSTGLPVPIFQMVPPGANVPPRVSLTGPMEVTKFTAPAVVDLKAVAEDSDGGIDKVEFYAGTTLIGEAKASGGGEYSLSWKDVPAGDYKLTAKAYDKLGAVTVSSPVNIYVREQGDTSTVTPVHSSLYKDVLVREIDYSAASTNSFIGSPSLVKLPDGTLVASHDDFGSGSTKKTTTVFTSADNGFTWSKSAVLTGQYWSNLFLYDGKLYIMGTSQEYGSVVIRESTDKGVTWTTPADSKSGLLSKAPDKYHTAPTPILRANGRIYRAMEEYGGSGWPNTKAFILSAPDTGANLLDAASWTKSGVASENIYLEGNPVEGPDGQVWDILRKHQVGKVGIFKLGDDNVTLTKYGEADMPGGDVKFSIRYDEVSKKYIALVNEHTDETVSPNAQRNVLSLIYSTDLVNWTRGKILIQEDVPGATWADSVKYYGFQYADWQFDGDNLIYVSRTSYDGANDFHNANRLTFHRLNNFRDYLKPDQNVAKYSFEDNANDPAGGNSGVVMGGTYSGGKFGKALSLDGSGYVDLHYYLGNALSGTDVVTVSAWINNSTLPAAGQAGNFIFGTRINAGGAGAEMLMNGSNIRVAGRSKQTDSYQYRDFPFSTTNEWHHLVGVIDYANKSIRLFIDKKEISPTVSGAVAFGANSYVRQSPAQTDKIGASPDGTSKFVGKLDEVSIFRKMLSQQEIDQLYDNGLAGLEKARLSGLVLSAGGLSPQFNRNITQYSMTVPYETDSLSVTPTTADNSATVRINGSDAASGTAGKPIPLNVGENTVTVTVVADNGASLSYKIKITRGTQQPKDSGISPATAVFDRNVAKSADIQVGLILNGNVFTGVKNGADMLTKDMDYTMSQDGLKVTIAKAYLASLGSSSVTLTFKFSAGIDSTLKVSFTDTTVPPVTPPGNTGGNQTGGSAGNPPVNSDIVSTTLQEGKGGKLNYHNEASILIPEGAAGQAVTLTLGKTENIDSLLQNGERPVSSVYEIGKSLPGKLTKPVTLTIRFDRNQLKPGQKAAIYQYNEDKKLWVRLGGTVTDNRISVESDQLGKFAVMADIGTAVFKDTKGHWAEENIRRAVDEGIVSGFPDGTFKPDKVVTRAEFVVMLMRTMNQQETGGIYFTDEAKIGAWAKTAIAQAAQAGIIKGYGDGSFDPQRNVTRAEMSAIIAKALNLQLDSNSTPGFVDDAKIPVWARAAVGSLADKGIVQGWDGGIFAPSSPTTRAEAITVILKMMDYRKNNSR